MSRSKHIHIVVVSDEHYLPLLAALIKSIEAHLAPDVHVNLLVIEDRVSAAGKKKLVSSVDPSVTTIQWKAMSEVIPPGTKLPLDQSTWPLNIYMRIFIPAMLPPDVNKVLYLDVDMIVEHDVSELWNVDLKDNIIGAVMDPNVSTFDNSWGGILNYKELGFDAKSKYFNTGLILIDRDKWLANDTTQKILDTIHQNTKFANFPDQYGLNIVAAGKWLPLDGRWNHFVTVAAREKPFIIHYVQRKPMYQSYANSREYQELFFHYLRQTAWKHMKPIGESKRYIKKIKNIIDKLIRRA
jgi:lipopolysaccharide biosynthesis glycosyltransferase